MSAYSDWKCGAITDDEYKSLARRENGDSSGRNVFVEEADCETCIHNKFLHYRGTIPVYACEKWECEYEENEE